ncbi:hypothetical protein [Methylosinus sp. PW1]|uniref:hypothetical protein n=1 Tax=Methylosinus sp. PW1 TaxID=107636 RepID=UPI0012EB07B4|nr:hypothetical protein [Methylosinus sp. PW1]
MLRPQAWLRKKWLRRALRDYPLYDPPHKVEERLLSREQAAENFDYFMSVRHERVAYFREWLRRYFCVSIWPDEKGVRALNRWGNKFAGLLVLVGPDGYPTGSYYTYDPPWTGENTGYNVIFDMGITTGEFIIGNCPNLHWDFDPISPVLPRRAEKLKQSAGMGFQRPRLTGFDDPVSEGVPLHNAYGFARQMLSNMVTVEGYRRYSGRPRGMRRMTRDQLLSGFTATIRIYPSGDLGGEIDELRRHMEPQEYLKFVDRISVEEEDDDDE